VSSFTPGSGRDSDAAAQDREDGYDERIRSILPGGLEGATRSQALYRTLVVYLRESGWLREERGSGWWWRDGFTEGTIADAVQQQMEVDGIDSRLMIDGEPPEFWSEVTYEA
jgi:hypothetical protein